MQDPAISRPGEMWHLNPRNLSQLVAMREPGINAVIGLFITARDAAAAMQGHNALSLIAEEYAAAESPEEFHTRVADILRLFGRLPNE